MDLPEVPTAKGVVIMDFKTDLELHDMINKYRRSLGWTWKRMLLVGAAEVIYKQGDNPDLILKIVNFLEGRR